VTRNTSKRYPAYQDSGVDWLGKIPAHWDLAKVKRLFRVVNGSTPVSSVPEYWDGDIVWVTPDDLGRLTFDTIAKGSRNISELGHASCATTLVPRGSLVLSTRAPIGHLAIAGVQLCTNQGCKCLVPRDGDHVRYFYYQLLAARPELRSLGDGSTFRELGSRKLEGVLLTCPSTEEQRTIADLLDRETAKIDALIPKKEHLIELLQEKRTALISQAVTKGLDPNVPTKDSGIEWLEEIPAHWQVKPLKHMTEMTNGFGFKPSGWGDQGIPIIRIENLNLGTEFNYTTRRVDPRFEVGYGDLLFGWSGNRGTSFGPFVWRRRGKYYLNQHIFRLSGYDCDAGWLYWALKGVTFYVEKQAHGIIGLVHITRKDFGAISLPVVPVDEQRSIAEFLDRETAKIDGLAAKVSEAIDQLREYRTALISAAVTGKIDVREVAS